MPSPSERRPSPLLRWLSVVLRGIHLAFVIGVGAAVLGAQISGQGQAVGVLISGVALFLLDLSGKPHLLLEWSGASLLIKLVVVAWMAMDATLQLPLFWAVVIWSVLFAHAPATFRHARWWRRT